MNFNQIKNMLLLNAALDNAVSAKGQKATDYVCRALIWKSPNSKEVVKIALSEKDEQKRVWFSITSTSRFQSYDVDLTSYEALMIDLDEYLLTVDNDPQSISAHLSAYKYHLINSYLENAVNSDRKKMTDLNFVSFLATILQYSYAQHKSRLF